MPSVADLAERFGLLLQGDGSGLISGAAALDSASPGDVSFLDNAKYAAQLASTHAGAVIVRAEHAAACPVPALVTDNPDLAFACVAALFDNATRAPAGIHPSAIIDAQAVVATDASIGAYCVIGAGARIEAGAVLGPHCVIGADCIVGPQCHLVARVTLVLRVTLGKRVLIHPGAVLGADGFGLVADVRDRANAHWVKVPQLGGVRIGDDCEIGANTTIDRGRLGDTVLGEDVRLDNQIQIAHNVQIGAHTAMAGCSAVAGSARIGRWCRIGGNAGVLGHLTLADGVTITAKSLVTHSIHAPGEYSSGAPLQDNDSWRRNAVRFKRLDEFARRLLKLEKATRHD